VERPAPLPGWGGLVTFLRAPAATPTDLRPGVVAVAGAPFDSTSSARWGARMAPRVLREGSVDMIANFQAVVERSLTHIDNGRTMDLVDDPPIVDVGDFVVFPSDVAKSTDSLADGMYAVARTGALPVILGGDHYVTYPMVRGFARAKAEAGVRRIGYLQIDAHLGLNDESGVWGKFSHLSSTRRVAELGVCDPSNMVWVGTSGAVPAGELGWLRRNGGHMFTSLDVRREGMAAVIRRAWDLASAGTQSVYVSVDIDCVDMAFAPGTGALVVGGLTTADLSAAIGFLSGQDVGAFEMVEVVPRFERNPVTSRIASNAVIGFVAPRVFALSPA
jgi:arginase family enzyme